MDGSNQATFLHAHQETSESSKVVMSIHFPVSAKKFLLPLVQKLESHGIPSELWVQDVEGHEKVLQDLGDQVRIVGSDLTVNPLVFLRRLSKYRKHLREVKPEVVHAHQTRASVIPLLAAWMEGIPHRIYNNHGFAYLSKNGVGRWICRWIEKLNIALSTDVLMVSHSNRQAAMEDKLLDARQGKVLGHGSAVGIELSQFTQFNQAGAKQAARQKFNLNDSRVVFGYVGRRVRHKGFHLLLDAWERSGLGEQGCELVMAGCSQLDCESVGKGSAKGIVPLGYIDDMESFYTACDVIALPSNHEGLPYALLEGAAAGCALLASDIPGNRCAIEHNVNGMLVPPGDLDKVVEALQILAADPELCKRLGQGGRKLVEEKYQRDYVLGEFLQYYQQMLDVVESETGMPSIDIRQNPPEETRREAA